MAEMMGWLTRGPEADPPIMDAGFLATLERHLGEAILLEILADGMIELDDRLGRLAEAGSEGDADAAARLAHDIAGLSGNLGLSAVSHASVALERALRGGGAADCPALANVLERGAPALEALRDELTRRGEPLPEPKDR